nr:hypothetical protein BaRGS_005958 [Batillaria attramentaria]
MKTRCRPGDEPAQYQQKTQEGVWVTLDCNWPAYSGLVWSQDLCRCEWGPNRTSVARLQYDSAPAKCLMMLNLNFNDGEVKDIGRDLWLDLRHPLSMEAVRDETAVGGWAGAFWGAGISDSWIDVNIHYDQNILEIFVNGIQCIRSAAFAGPIMPIDCALTLLEDNFCGMLDELKDTDKIHC